MKKLVLAAAFAVLGASSGANAAIYNLGPLTAGAPIPFNSGTTPIVPGAFQDIFTFLLPANGGSGYAVQDLSIDLGALGTISSVFTTFGLVSNPDGILFNADDAVVPGSVVTGPSSALSFTLPGSDGGSAYIVIQGIATGTLGGVYNGAISVAAPAPVPEPGTWGMMATGGLLLGFALRRNRTK